MSLSVIILAAGQGKRMHSELPKVLHLLAGKSLLEHVVRTAEQITKDITVVIGHQSDRVRHALAHLQVDWVLQSELLGTGHALLQALPTIKPDKRILVLYGDVPLITAETLQKFIQETPANSIGIITAILDNPHGLGRILRNENDQILEIIEEQDTNAAQRKIKEINSGIYLFPSHLLEKYLPNLKNQNKQQEFYLTDLIKYAVKERISIKSFIASNNEEILGINDRSQLAYLERCYQKRLANKFMQQGVTLADPDRFDIRGELSTGQDVFIDINVICEGRVIIGKHCHIGPHVILRNVILGDQVEIRAHSIIDGAEIAAESIIGPFARIRPGTVIAEHARVGNFVEIKNSMIGIGSKINHLSYVGDSQIGKQVNIGAGTITCNYDGINKYRTIIEDNVFIGSNTQLVAPIKIGEGATIGAGSTITKDAPPHQLTLCRTQQKTIANWKRTKKKEV